MMKEENKNEKKIEEFLHLYLGCRIWITKNIEGADVIDTLTPKVLMDVLENPIGEKLILRQLSSQTREEMLEELQISKSLGDDVTGAEVAAAITLHRLKKGFDLFQLIDAGLAIDSQSQKQDHG